MDREEMIEFIVIAIEEIEGVSLSYDYFKDYTHEELIEKVDFYEHVLEK